MQTLATPPPVIIMNAHPAASTSRPALPASAVRAPVTQQKLTELTERANRLFTHWDKRIASVTSTPQPAETLAVPTPKSGFWNSVLSFLRIRKPLAALPAPGPQTMVQGAQTLDPKSDANSIFAKILAAAPASRTEDHLARPFAELEVELLGIDRQTAFELFQLMLTKIPEFKLRDFAKASNPNAATQADATELERANAEIEALFPPISQESYYADYLDHVGVLAKALMQGALDDAEKTIIHNILESKIDQLETGDSSAYAFATDMELIEQLSPLLTDKQQLRFAAKLVLISRHLPDNEVVKNRFWQIFDRALSQFNIGDYLLAVSQGTTIPSQGDAIGILDFITQNTEKIDGETLSHVLASLAKYNAHENPIVRNNYRGYIQSCFAQAKTKRAHVLFEVLKILETNKGDDIRKSELNAFYLQLTDSMSQSEIADCLRPLMLLLHDLSASNAIRDTALQLVQKLESDSAVLSWIEQLSDDDEKRFGPDDADWIKEMRVLEQTLTYFATHKLNWDHAELKRRLSQKIKKQIFSVLLPENPGQSPSPLLEFYTKIASYLTAADIREKLPVIALHIVAKNSYSSAQISTQSLLDQLDAVTDLDPWIATLPVFGLQEDREDWVDSAPELSANRDGEESGPRSHDQEQLIESAFNVLQYLQDKKKLWDFTPVKNTLATKLGIACNNESFAEMRDAFWHKQIELQIDVAGIFASQYPHEQQRQFDDVMRTAEYLFSNIQSEYWFTQWDRLQQAAKDSNAKTPAEKKCMQHAKFILGYLSMPYGGFAKWREYLFSNVPDRYWVTLDQFKLIKPTISETVMATMTLFSDDTPAKKREEAAKKLDDWSEILSPAIWKKIAAELKLTAVFSLKAKLTLSLLYERGLGVRASIVEAAALVWQAYQQDPNNQTVITRMAWLSELDAIQKTGWRLSTIANILERHPNNPSAVAAIGGLYLFGRGNKVKDESRADDIFSEVLKNDPKNPLALFFLGTIYAFRKNYEKAKDYYWESVYSGYALPCTWLMMADMAQNKLAEIHSLSATGYYLGALRRFPTYEYCWERLSELKSKNKYDSDINSAYAKAEKIRAAAGVN